MNFSPQIYFFNFKHTHNNVTNSLQYRSADYMYIGIRTIPRNATINCISTYKTPFSETHHATRSCKKVPSNKLYKRISHRRIFALCVCVCVSVFFYLFIFFLMQPTRVRVVHVIPGILSLHSTRLSGSSIYAERSAGNIKEDSHMQLRCHRI